MKLQTRAAALFRRGADDTIVPGFAAALAR